MWLCMNDGFVSAVQDWENPKKLVVRARKREHLVALFGKKTPVKTTLNTDYRFRVSVTRERFASLICRRLMKLAYTNFKDSVADKQLHDMYAGWWVDHYRLQNEAGYRPEGYARRWNLDPAVVVLDEPEAVEEPAAPAWNAPERWHERPLSADFEEQHLGRFFADMEAVKEDE